MPKGRLFSPLIIAVVLLAGFLVYINWSGKEADEKKAPQSTPVKIATVSLEAFPIIIEALGTATANESVTITARSTEVVSAITFEDGEIVKQGQLLVQFDDREELARMNELDVNLAEAQRQYARIKNLRQQNATSEQLLDEQDARVKSLQAQLEVAKSQLSDLKINAPFSGQLGIREVSLGSLVEPADVITTLDDTSKIKVDFSVSETHLASLRPGQFVTARSVAYPDETFKGEIATVGSRIDPVTRSVSVRAIIDNQSAKLRPGMLLQVILEKKVLQALVIPEKALVPNDDKQFVFVLEGEMVHKKEIKIGARRPGIVQVLEGISAGQQVVVEGTLRVQDQSKVRVLNAGGV